MAPGFGLGAAVSDGVPLLVGDRDAPRRLRVLGGSVRQVADLRGGPPARAVPTATLSWRWRLVAALGHSQDDGPARADLDGTVLPDDYLTAADELLSHAHRQAPNPLQIPPGVRPVAAAIDRLAAAVEALSPPSSAPPSSGCLESRVLPQMRRLEDLEILTHGANMPEAHTIEAQIRPIVFAPDLISADGFLDQNAVKASEEQC